MGFIAKVLGAITSPVAAVVAGGLSLAGSLLTNKTNRQLATTANNLTKEQFERSLQFNKQEADISRQFSAHQAGIAREFNSREAAENRAFNSAEAAKARQWYTNMSNTAHQREVTDLKAAGLNPILSATGGSGAPVSASPSASGSAAAAQAASSAMASAGGGGSYHAPVMQNALGNAISSAMDVAQTGQSMKESDSRIDKVSAEITRIGVQNGLTEEETARVTQEVVNLRVEAVKKVADMNLTNANTRNKQIQNEYERMKIDYIKKTPGTLPALVSGKTTGLVLNVWKKISNVLEREWNDLKDYTKDIGKPYIEYNPQ